jgi:hypothetical protein
MCIALMHLLAFCSVMLQAPGTYVVCSKATGGVGRVRGSSLSAASAILATGDAEAVVATVDVLHSSDRRGGDCELHFVSLFTLSVSRWLCAALQLLAVQPADKPMLSSTRTNKQAQTQVTPSVGALVYQLCEPRVRRSRAQCVTSSSHQVEPARVLVGAGHMGQWPKQCHQCPSLWLIRLPAISVRVPFGGGGPWLL